MKVAGVDQKRNYRIQAASPGLAMLSAIDGGPDDRPVEVVDRNGSAGLRQGA